MIVRIAISQSLLRTLGAGLLQISKNEHHRSRLKIKWERVVLCLIDQRCDDKADDMDEIIEKEIRSVPGVKLPLENVLRLQGTTLKVSSQPDFPPRKAATLYEH